MFSLLQGILILTINFPILFNFSWYLVFFFLFPHIVYFAMFPIVPMRYSMVIWSCSHIIYRIYSMIYFSLFTHYPWNILSCVLWHWLSIYIVEDMTHMNTPMKIKNSMSSFLCLHIDISKDLLLPNVSIFNVFREQFEDAINLGQNFYVASVTHGKWVHGKSRVMKPSKHNIWFVGSPTLRRWKFITPYSECD